MGWGPDCGEVCGRLPFGWPATLLLEGKAFLELAADPKWCLGLGSSERGPQEGSAGK